MHRVVYQLCRDGSGGSLWVHKPHGCWRRITFARLVDVLDRLGGATTTVLPGVLLAAQSAACAVAATPKASRAGPINAAVQPCGP